jgi:hypothetical protein
MRRGRGRRSFAKDEEFDEEANQEYNGYLAQQETLGEGEAACQALAKAMTLERI